MGKEFLIFPFPAVGYHMLSSQEGINYSPHEKMVDSDDFFTPKVPEDLTSQDDFSAEDRLYYGLSTYRTTASNMGYDLGRLGATFFVSGWSRKTGCLGDVLHDDSFKVDVCSLKKAV